jgi:hypothetical protein
MMNEDPRRQRYWWIDWRTVRIVLAGLCCWALGMVAATYLNSRPLFIIGIIGFVACWCYMATLAIRGTWAEMNAWRAWLSRRR